MTAISTAGGGSVSIAEVAKWYRKAADLDHAEAQRRLGDCYSYTASPLLPSLPKSDLPQNYSEALYWHNKAAANGDLESYNRMGHHYAYGWGVQKNESEAIRWYMKGVNKNYADSMYAMASYYFVKEPLYSYAWSYLGSLKSVKSGEEVSDKTFSYSKSVLSPEEIKEANDWARSWKPGTTEESILTTATLSDPATPVRRMNRAMAARCYDIVRACVLEDQHRLLQVLEQRKESFLNLNYAFKEYNREVSGSTAKIMHNTPNGKSYVTVVVRTGDRWKVDFKQTVLENN